MDRTERFYRIDQLINNRKQVTTREFIEELGISLATFKRAPKEANWCGRLLRYVMAIARERAMAGCGYRSGYTKIRALLLTGDPLFRLNRKRHVPSTTHPERG